MSAEEQEEYLRVFELCHAALIKELRRQREAEDDGADDDDA